VNAGFGDAHSAAELVEYANGPATSMWGAVRAKNGHPAPYKIKYWNIGNEPYGAWQLGHTTAKYFVLKHNEFARAMRKVDPAIILLGSGAMPDQMKPEGVKENASLDSIQAKFGTDLDWTGSLLTNSWGYFDGLTEHWYDKAEQRRDAPASDELLEFARQPSNQVRMKAAEWAEYQRRFPAMKDKGIFLWIDEYAYTGAPANLKSALAYAMVLQEMLRHTDFLKMSAFTMGVSTLDITPTASVLNSTGEVFKLYGDHFGAGEVPVAVSGNSPQAAARYPVGFDHPQVSAGSPTYPLDVIAALSPDRQKLTISVVNATQTAQPLDVTVMGGTVKGPGTRWQLSGANLDAANTVEAAPGVTIDRSESGDLSGGLSVPPISATVYEYSVEATGTGN
jgi:alpha-L-arabinofuranosidase